MNNMKRDLLIKLRKSKNLTQKDVAEKIGITTSYYGMIELGKRTPNLVYAKKIANFFNVTLDEIFFNNSEYIA